MFLKSPKKLEPQQQIKLKKPKLGVIYHQTVINWWLFKIVQRIDVM